MSERADHAVHGSEAHRESLLGLCLTALGIVYGDIGTSPLYALRECFHGAHHMPVTPYNLLGVLSLISWALILVVSVKYVAYVMRADNRGEGGVLALMGLAVKADPRSAGIATLLGIFGAGLLYGDGMITPAISVMSAIEGLEIATPALAHLVLPVTIAILVGLFMLQQRGTGAMGSMFGPVILVWFVTIAALGLRAIIATPAILHGLVPNHGIAFLLREPRLALPALGSVFLAVTGAEALYADIGHTGKRPIRLTWYYLVLPALLLNYFGQGALLLQQPDRVENPFYHLAPPWALYPLMGLATAATIIASQALITGAFSLARQATMLGLSPRMAVHHTSAAHEGQIYVPAINWLLMLSSIGLVLGFRSSSSLATAYGVAVVLTMIITTLMAYVVARQVWKWSAPTALLVTVVLLAVDGAFLSANLLKIFDGGWFPLLVGGAFFVVMTTWRRGRMLLQAHLKENALDLEEFFEIMRVERAARVPGTAVFMTGTGTGTPAALLHNFTHNRVVHEHTVLLTVLTADRPRVPLDERVEMRQLEHGFVRIFALYGFMEQPDIPKVLASAHVPGYSLDYTAFFFGRETILPGEHREIAHWRRQLFNFLARTAQPATVFFRIPPENVFEIGQQLRL